MDDALTDAPRVQWSAVEPAPAKVNLCLHVTGHDGAYHTLDSLVVFADVCDRLQVRYAPDLPSDQIIISGPFAPAIDASSNSILDAARWFRKQVGDIKLPALQFNLFKSLPVSAGIGGGSADAAAALRLLEQLTDRAIRSDAPVAELGADVPVCFRNAPARMQGIGERLTLLDPMPDLPLLLVNPATPSSTAAVFSALTSKDNAPLDLPSPAWTDQDSLLALLQRQRNDLYFPARELVPEIEQLLSELQDTTGCRLARMSGSGSTCFGIYSTPREADAAAGQFRQAHPDWWVEPTNLFKGKVPHASKS